MLRFGAVVGVGLGAALVLLELRRRRRLRHNPTLNGVRRAHTGDFDTIVAFTKELALETEATDLPDKGVRKGVACGLGGGGDGLHPRYWIYCDATGAAVGVVLTSPELSDWHGSEYWWVSSLFVSASQRRKGIAQALLGAVLDDARAEGVQTVNLRVEKANEPALSLYRKCGFVVDDSHHVMSSGRTPSGHVVGRG